MMSSKRSFLFSTFLAFASSLGGCDGGGSAACDPACDLENFETCCDGVCVTFRDDEQNCGACGNACEAGQTCQANACVDTTSIDGGPMTGVDGGMLCGAVTCPDGQRCCSARCVNQSVPVGTDGRSDPSFDNCGACGFECDPEKASACSVPSSGGDETPPECLCGGFRCVGDGEVCINNPSVGGFGCTNLSTDRNNCGEIGNVCPTGESCSGGVCGCGTTGAPCGSGEACCGGACIDVSSDAANCGECGNACGASAPNCQAGTCVCGTGETARACNPTTMTDLGESCCDDACVANDDTNCGCGVVCDGDECIADSDLFGTGGGGGVCCGNEFLPGFGVCSDFGGTPDGGLPFP